MKKAPLTVNTQNPTQLRSAEDRKKLLADLEKQRQDLLNEEVAPILERLKAVCIDLNTIQYQPPTLVDRIKAVIQKSPTPPTAADIQKALTGQFIVTRIGKFTLSNAVARFSADSKDAKEGKVQALWTEDADGRLVLVS